MNNKDRQLYLDTKMYRSKTFGKQPFCAKCWAKLHNGCLVNGQMRSINLLCCKAECRLNGVSFQLREVVCPPSKPGVLYGLKSEDLK